MRSQGGQTAGSMGDIMKLRAVAIAALACGLLGATVPASAQGWMLTPYGLGPIKIGMTADQVGKLAGRSISLADDDESDNPEACAVIALPDHSGVNVLFENGKLTSIWLWAGSTEATREGVRVGNGEDEVKAAYASLEITAADYDERPALDMTYWVKKDVAGLKFRTNTQRKVTSIAAGAHSILYEEGGL